MTTPLEMAEERLAELRSTYEEWLRRANPDMPEDAVITLPGSAEELEKAIRVRGDLLQDLIDIGPSGDVDEFAAGLYQDELTHLVEEACRATILVEALMLAGSSDDN